ncbi:MAG: hypothetical protein Q8O30_11410 [Candidatus Omnitrophota bacterium]|nr:hypothetical protein [Candidatus Omnitrophota bacterium]
MPVLAKNEAPRANPSTLFRMVRRNGERSRTKARGFLYPLRAQHNPDHAFILGVKAEVLSRRDK